jgi:hypothetical protein
VSDEFYEDDSNNILQIPDKTNLRQSSRKEDDVRKLEEEIPDLEIADNKAAEDPDIPPVEKLTVTKNTR